MATRLGRSVTVKLAEEKSDVVSTKSTEYLEMQEIGMWDLIRDLWQGTRAMRDAGELWLPRNEQEALNRYRDRVRRSFLFNAFRDTIEGTVSKPLSKPITLTSVIDNNALPEEIQNLHLDVDRTGTNLQEFTKDVFIDAQQYGVTHAFIDFPTIPQGLNLEQERELKPRPIWLNVSPPNLLGWKFDQQNELLQVRMRETRVLPVANSKFLDERATFIRVYNRDTWELWRERVDRNGKVNFQLVATDSHDFGAVPFVTYYTNKLAELTGVSPFLNLAWLNLAHWQSSSDQRNILRIARVANLVITGLTEEELDKATVLGADSTHRFTNPETKMFFAEHSGQAIGAGEVDIQKLEEQMETMGLTLVSTKRTGSVTATEIAQKSSKTMSLIQQWIRDLEIFLEQCYKLSAQWMNTTMPDDFAVDIFDDFTITFKSNDDIDRIIKLKENEVIDQETTLKETKRRGLLSDDADIDQIMANTAQEKEQNLSLTGLTFDDILNDDDE